MPLSPALPDRHPEAAPLAVLCCQLVRPDPCRVLTLPCSCTGTCCACLLPCQMARGILAIGSMMGASINKTAVALGGALDNYAANAMNRSPPLSEPLTLSKSYVSRCADGQSWQPG